MTGPIIEAPGGRDVELRRLNQLLVDAQANIENIEREFERERLQHRVDNESAASAIAQEAHEKAVLEQVEADLRSRLAAARDAARRLVALVDNLGAFADDSDPRIMATAGPIGEAQAELWRALGLDLDAEAARLRKDIESRCAVCGWPLALPPDKAGTCLRGDCSMRPRPQRLYAPARAEIELAARRAEGRLGIAPRRQDRAAVADVELIDRGSVSDGYHTFNELYAHRSSLFIGLCAEVDARTPTGYVWRSKKHSDGTMFDGWFVMGIGTAPGEQISYHLPIARWPDTDWLGTERPIAPEFDGHTPADVLDRLKRFAR